MPKLTLQNIHYRNVKLLQRSLTPAGSILPRAKTGLSAKLQRRLSREIKRARQMAMMPFTTTL